MGSIFKKNLDDEKLKKILKNFLTEYCIYENNYFIINNEILKNIK